MKQTKRDKPTRANGMTKNVRFLMSEELWDGLNQVAEVEGREQGRPKSVAAVMRKLLAAGVQARVKA